MVPVRDRFYHDRSSALQKRLIYESPRRGISHYLLSVKRGHQVCCLALADIAAEYWLDVNDRRPVQRFEMAHPHASAVDGGDLDPVQANGIGAVRRARTEDAFLHPGGVPPWVHAQNVATRAIEPGDDDNFIAAPEAPETFKHLRVEDQPGLGCTFVGLQRGRPEISQAGRDPPDGFHLETRQALLPISLGSVYLRKRRRAAVPYGFVASTQNPLLVSTQTHLQHAIVWSDFEEVADPGAAISIHARHDDATQPTQDP